MGKKVYLDYKYKMDCEQQINYVSYLINNSTPRVTAIYTDKNTYNINSNDNNGDVLYSYSDINGTVCKKLTIT